jgi:hypothetical protein
MQTRVKAKRSIGAYMAKKTRPYRMEAIAGIDLDAETEDEGTEIGIAAQGKWIILSKRCLNALRPDCFFAARWNLDCSKPGREHSTGASSHGHAIVRPGVTTAACRSAFHQTLY